jgi:hypothetical protein
MYDYSTDGDAILMDEAVALLAASRRKLAKPKVTIPWAGHGRKVSDHDIALMRARHRLGVSYHRLGKMFNVSRYTVDGVLRGIRAYKDRR